MADISVTQTHQLTREQAKQAAQKVADQMAQEFDMRIAWEGDMLNFRRSGIAGTLALQATAATLEITLTGMLKAFASTIEEKVGRNMQKVFGGTN